MPDTKTKSQGTQPPPTSDRGHPLPRRSSPENSVTLRHHQHAREASARVVANKLSKNQPNTSRRNSSGESYGTMQSDPQKWFDQSNENPHASYKENTMGVDSPFFQKDAVSSQANSGTDPYAHRALQIPGVRPSIAHSSSADDYRSVIDDLTVENTRLKEELKRYRQFAPATMRKERLFEVKFHGLHPTKRRELENTLRDFAASVGESSEATSRRKSAKQLKASYGAQSKHASSSSSHSRPVDSAYASASTGPNSSGISLTQPSAGSRAKSSELKVERYLQDIPEALYPGGVSLDLPDHDKKVVVVRKLEQLFTGKIRGRHLHKTQSRPRLQGQADNPSLGVPQVLEASREACIQPLEQHKKNRSRGNLSSNSNTNSHSHGETTDSQLNGDGSGSGGSGSGSGHINPPPTAELPEQRPTRLSDLDPDRVQIPSENMDYIRHLGLTAPEHLHKTILPDADGWVYLNLLANMAQLHIFNVNLEFIRRAVRSTSTQLQLSAKGDKIRWRGGTQGTRFTSDSSDDRNSQQSPSTDEDEDGSDQNGQRKRQKVGVSGEKSKSVPSIQTLSKPTNQGSSESFHYKPLFIQQNSSMETSASGSASPSYGNNEESNAGNTSRWGLSGSGSSPRRKRRIDGAMVFYSGAPFCTDLSGDPGDISPTMYMASTLQDQEAEKSLPPPRLVPQRTLSGSEIPFRPLIDGPGVLDPIGIDILHDSELNMAAHDDSTSEFSWANCEASEDPVVSGVVLEPSGVGQVYPEDHFRVVVTTRRPLIRAVQAADGSRPNIHRNWSEETTDSMISRLAHMTASSPLPAKAVKMIEPTLTIEYVGGRIRRLAPMPLPPPAQYIPPFDTSESGSEELASWEEEDDDDVEENEDGMLPSSVEEVLSKRANHYESDKTSANDMDSSSNEEDEKEQNEVDLAARARLHEIFKQPRQELARLTAVDPNSSSSLIGKTLPLRRAGSSSIATAGGAESGYVSSMEDE